MSIVETYFKSRQEARDWLDFNCSDEELVHAAFDENDRFAEWQIWKGTTRHFYTEDAVLDLAQAAFRRWLGRPNPDDANFVDSLVDELDERAARVVLS